MELTFHGTDDQLENYALGRLSDSALPVLEEHLMVCAVCRERLDRIEDFALGMQSALREAALKEAAPGIDAGPETSGFAAWFSGSGFGFLKKPAFSIALGIAALVAVTVFYMSGRTKVAPTASLQLTAIRGEMPFAAPARELDLTLVDAPPSGGPFRVEVVDAMGNPQWSGVVNGGPGGVAVKVQRQLAPGDYFVRLYGADNQVLHEYGFRVRG